MTQELDEETWNRYRLRCAKLSEILPRSERSLASVRMTDWTSVVRFGQGDTKKGFGISFGEAQGGLSFRSDDAKRRSSAEFGIWTLTRAESTRRGFALTGRGNPGSIGFARDDTRIG